MFEHDTICAVATASGGAIGIVRVSGPSAISIADVVFKGRNPLASAKSHTLHFGHILKDDGSILDEVLVSVFRSPKSYTGENSVEFSCHASGYILQELCTMLISQGCRAAKPGEFTQRAFLNHRLDLAQAEAVADVIAADNAASHRLAMQQMRGTYSSELKKLRDRLIKLASLLELELDFSDHEDLEFVNREELMKQCNCLRQEITRLANSFSLGNAIKKGISVAIIGAPNVGKSTLLNALVHENRAIVSDIQGTTRDTIDASVNIDSHTFRFIDTAGIRHTNDVIEQMGIERSIMAANQAQIILLLSDGNMDFPVYNAVEGQNVLKIFTKSDITTSFNTKHLRPSEQEDCRCLFVSALKGTGMNALERTLVEIADSFFASTSSDIIVTNLRHYQALVHANESLHRVFQGLHQGVPNEFVAQDLRECLSFVSDIIGGSILPDDILGSIFSTFCIGK